MEPDQIPLRDLHLPDPVGWWPLAPGWWVLIALAVAGVVYLLYLRYLKWRANAARRAALGELARIYSDFGSGAEATGIAIRVSELLRRSMLAYAPRSEVAGLTGERWLQWLDRGLDGRPFSEGPGRELESLPYRPAAGATDERDLHALFEAVRLRLKTPLPGGLA